MTMPTKTPTLRFDPGHASINLALSDRIHYATDNNHTCIAKPLGHPAPADELQCPRVASSRFAKKWILFLKDCLQEFFEHRASADHGNPGWLGQPGAGGLTSEKDA